ncbi:hypothetical protein VNO78_20255 [Psophocarpus tetragonolobus]|uniref:Uncharacterized protein n=1 Tax=Psophocarpus tetragonolobus TaxID=3891 RepID=A0AAN9S9H2_PSOTE
MLNHPPLGVCLAPWHSQLCMSAQRSLFGHSALIIFWVYIFVSKSGAKKYMTPVQKRQYASGVNSPDLGLIAQTMNPHNLPILTEVVNSQRLYLRGVHVTFDGEYINALLGTTLQLHHGRLLEFTAQLNNIEVITKQGMSINIDGYISTEIHTSVAPFAFVLLLKVLSLPIISQTKELWIQHHHLLDLPDKDRDQLLQLISLKKDLTLLFRWEGISATASNDDDEDEEQQIRRAEDASMHDKDKEDWLHDLFASKTHCSFDFIAFLLVSFILFPCMI